MNTLPDLHRHLDGSLRMGTLLELAERYRVAVPAQLAFSKGMGLGEALQRFAVTLAVLQEPSGVRRVASEICEDAREEGVSTLEIRFAPQLHQGARVEAVVDAAIEGAAGRAGMILCGLYGESPEVLRLLVAVARSRPGVVGIDLAGGPASGQSFELKDYERPFGLARDLGLGRTVHAGEGRPPEEIRVAVQQLHAQRIGHGTTLLEDPYLVELLLRREVTLEACPTSNVHTGVIDEVSEHPIARWLEQGLRACICTDNTLFSETDARTEHERAAAIPGMSQERISAAIAHGHAAAFRRG